jgi:hypothetical protein
MKVKWGEHIARIGSLGKLYGDHLWKIIADIIIIIKFILKEHVVMGYGGFECLYMESSYMRG